MDVAAMNALLDAGYGTTRATGLPAAHDLALFVGDPAVGGVELLAVGGYARITVAAADWLPAANGEKSTVELQFPAATGAWSGEGSHWGLYDGTTLWDSGALVVPVVVLAAGPGPKGVVTVRWADSIIPDE